uniref:Replicase large subunit n=1 Tax=Hammarskog virga-like virus TaxID=2665440 RepID=A0A5Q0V0H3_9VIRU|nr:hypothetical protein [Hammarskog virga-like virus]
MTWELGLCYKGLVADICNQLGCNEEEVLREQSNVVTALNRYPTVRRMLSYLVWRYPEARFKVVHSMEHVGGYLLHYPGRRQMRFYEFFIYYWTFQGYSVGGDNVIQVDPHKILSSFGVDASELAQRAIRSAVPVEVVTDLVSASIASEVRKMTEVHRNDKKIRIPFRPTTDLRRILESSYEHYSLEYSGGTCQHSYAAASRVIEIEEMLNKLKYSNNVPPRSGWDAHIVDVGGNWMTHFMRGRRYIHCDSPILGANDARRASDRKVRLRTTQRFTSTQVEIAEQMVKKAEPLDRTSPVFCLKKGAQCKVKAPACMFVHSTYDMTAIEIADTMDNHQSSVAYGTFIFVPEILLNVDVGAEGYVPVYDAKWQIMVMGKRKVIRFSFVNDASYNYLHDLDTYTAMATNKHLVSTEGVTYMVELLQNINGTQYFKILRIDVCSFDVDPVMHSLWFKDDKAVRVTYYVLDAKYAQMGQRRLQKKSMTVASDFLGPLMQFATRASDNKFSVTDIFAYACSMASRMIINGTTVTARTDEFSRDVDYRLFDLVHFVFVRTYEIKYNCGQVDNEVMDEIKEERKRNQMSLFEIYKYCMKKRWSKVISDWKFDIVNYFLGSMFQRKYVCDYGLISRELVFSDLIRVSKPGLDAVDGVTHAELEKVVDCCSIYLSETKLESRLAGGFESVVCGVGRSTCLEQELELTRMIMPGDGHCQFHAINAAMGYPHPSGIELRELYAGEMGAPASMQSSAWGDEQSLDFLAQKMNIRICVHIVSTDLEKFRVFGTDGKICHLEYVTDHYNVLVTPTTVTRRPQDGPLLVANPKPEGSPISVLAYLVDAFSPTALDKYLLQVRKYENDVREMIKYRCQLARSLASTPKQLTDVSYAVVNKAPPFPDAVDALCADSFKIYCHTTVRYLHAATLSINHIANALGVSSAYRRIFHKQDDSVQLMSERVYLHDIKVAMRDIVDMAKGKDIAPHITREIAKAAVEVAVTPVVAAQELAEASRNATDIVPATETAVMQTVATMITPEALTPVTTISMRGTPSAISRQSSVTCASSVVDDIRRLRAGIALASDELYDQQRARILPAFPDDCFNRSQAKLRSVLVELQLVYTSALDLCSGPGGFALELARSVDVQAVFYKYAAEGARPHDSIATNSRITVVEVTPDNDIIDPVFVRSIASKVTMVDLVTADGCINSNTVDPETENFQLISNECSAGCAVLKEGGSMIVKMFDLLDVTTRHLVRTVAAQFTRTRIIRSEYSSPIGGELYVCFIGKISSADYSAAERTRVYLREFIRRFSRELKDNLYTFSAQLTTREGGRTTDWVEASPETQRQKTAEQKDLKVLRCEAEPENFSAFVTERVGVQRTDAPLPGLGIVARKGKTFLVKKHPHLILIHYTTPQQVVSWVEGFFTAHNITVSVLADDQFPEVTKNFYLIHREQRLPTTTHAEAAGGGLELQWATTEAYQRYWRDADRSYEIDLNIPQSRYVFCRNAVRECREHWLLLSRTVETKYQLFYEMIERGRNALSPLSIKGLTKLCAESGEDYGLIMGGAYLLRPVDMEFYEFGYDGKRFVKIEYPSNVHCPKYDASGLVLVGKSTKLMQQTRMYNATDRMEIMDLYVPTIMLRSGVPGCGKTKYILDNVGPQDFILTTTRENKQDIVARCPRMQARIKTVHSVIINAGAFKTLKVKVLFIDEALMSHAGELLIAIDVLHPERVEMSGDEKQIPFINRTAAMVMKYLSALEICDFMSYVSASYRVPQDVAKLFSTSYARGFTTNNPVKRSLVYKIVSGYSELPKDGVVLVFKQSEKAMLALAGYKVSTVHEFQGKQVPVVYLYRHSTIASDQIYLSAPHVLVALTRHSQQLVYYTRLQDEICAKINSTREYLDADLRSNLVGGGGGGLMFRNCKYSGPDYSSIVEYGFGYNVPRMRMFKPYREHSNIRRTRVRIRGVSMQPQALQQWFDTILPGISLVSRTYDNSLVHSDELSVAIAGKVTLDLTKIGVPEKKFDFMRPVLRTGMGLERIRTQRESLLAYIKRNDAVPVPQIPVDPQYMVDLMLQKFMGYFDEEALRNVCSAPVELNSESIHLWTTAQNKRVDLTADQYLPEMDLSKYEFMIKPRAKPDLTMQGDTVYAALQTIAYQPVQINQLLCPLFKDLKEKVLAALKPQFRIFSDVTITEFASQLNKLYPEGFSPTSSIYEFDVSKYDKSQGEIALLFDAAIMRLFGISEEIVQVWIASHRATTLVDYRAGLRTEVVYQRKSGDPFTFLGNTLFLMGCLAVVLPLDQIEFAAFGGDDQIIVADWDLGLDSVQFFESVFNLEVKLFRRRFPYFCSKFLIFAGGQWRFLPDLLKMVIKFGRHDLRNPEHIEDYRVSLKDLFSVYNDYTLVPVFNDAFNERYPSMLTDHTYTIEIITALLKTPEAFASLYYTLPNDTLCEDPTRPEIKQM